MENKIQIEKQAEKVIQKQMAEKLLEASEDKINRNIKDSVFCDLFGQQEYLYQLYQALHPEDTETETDDLTIVTLSRIIVREMYNDLGFLAGNRLIVLVEAQSSWSENIVVRFLMYLGETYRRYIEKNDLELYTTKRMTLPKPELYVVYTGDRKTRPGTISLKKSFWNTDDSCVEVEAKVIYDSKAGDILSQFIDFSHVFDSQRKMYSDDMRKAVQETIRICREKNVLRDYLKGEEAAAVMFAFADQEKEFNKALRTERREGISIGEARGEARGEAKGKDKNILSLICKKLRKHQSAEMIADALEEDVMEIQKICNMIAPLAPDYDEEKAYELLHPSDDEAISA